MGSLIMNPSGNWLPNTIPPNEDFDKELQALFTTTRQSVIHQLLRNSCVPLGYIVVYFCASMIPDPPPSSDSAVGFESSFVE